MRMSADTTSFPDCEPPRIRQEYGRFLDDASYALEDPATPRPWQHLLSNPDYLLSITQLGTGFSTYRGIFANRVTQSYAETEFDDKTSGRFFYIRDAETGDVFSPTVYPVESDLTRFDSYRCTYGFGTLDWHVKTRGLDCRLGVVVPPQESCELYHLELAALDGKPRQLDVFFYLEWLFGGAPRDQGFGIVTGFDRQANTLWANVKTDPRYRFHQSGFITATVPICDFDSRRLAFRGPLGTLSAPDAVRRGSCTNSGAPFIGTTCGAIRMRIDVPAHTPTSLTVAVGVAENGEAALTRARHQAQADSYTRARDQVREEWNATLARQTFMKTDDPVVGFADTWLKYQMVQNARWTRWAAKKGYRDVLQDAAGLRLLDPDRATQMFLEAVRHQRADGHAPRGWDLAPWSSHVWIDARDCPAWLFYAADALIRETGNTDLLNRLEPFVNSDQAVSVFEHLVRAADFLWKERGQRGLCLFGESDWNDSLNTVGIEGRGESVWLSQMVCHGFGLLADLAGLAGREDTASLTRERRRQLAAAIEEHAWDGQWYLRGFTDHDRRLGSRTCAEGGQIYLLPQAWAVIAGVGSAERIASSMQAVDDHLEGELGPMLYAPRYQDYDPEIGRISLGGSESDSVYVHAAMFKVQADLLRGDADRAWATIRKLLPVTRTVPASQSGAEPFCCVNAYTGPTWSWSGWSYTGWWTGSAAWLIQILIEWVYGARAELGGLRIDPHLPSDWGQAGITRCFRGAIYAIRIERVSEGQTGILVDGQPLDGTLIAPRPAGTTVRVDCRLPA